MYVHVYPIHARPFVYHNALEAMKLKKAVTGIRREQKIRDTYDRLGVTTSQVAEQPLIAHILRNMFKDESEWVPHTYKKQGKFIMCEGCDKCSDGLVEIKKPVDWLEKVIEYLRGSDAKEARAWLDKFSGIPDADRRLVPFEAYCVAVGVGTKRMWEVIQGAIFEQAAMESAVLAAASHPGVVRATVDFAKLPSGSKERQMLHLHSGFLPVPKNTVNIIKEQNNIQDNRQTANVTLAPVDDTIRRVTDRFNEIHATSQKALPAPVVVEAESEEV